MKRELKKYIGIFFVLLYSFPFVYQAGHIIVHQSHKISEYSSCTHRNSETSFYVDSKNNVEEDCPICDYQFTLFDEVAPVISEKYFPKYCKLKFSFTYPEVSTYCRNQNSSRAPPFFS